MAMQTYWGMRIVPRRRFGLVGLCALILSGCTERAQQSGDDQGGAGPIVETAECGPVKMRVSVDKGEITLAERLALTIEVTAQAGVDVEMPPFGDQLGEFGIRDFRDEVAVPVEGGRRWRQVYDLDIFVSGEYTIPGMTARFVDRRKGDENVVEGEISTEPFAVTVTSLMEGTFDPTQFRDVKGPVRLPVSRAAMWMWWLGGGLGGLTIVVLLVAWLIRRARRPAPEIIIPPHEWAFDELQRLIDDQLVEQGLVHEFYSRLSMIVRRYIEKRFGLTAPELTTEEFLVEVQRDTRLPFDHRGSLGGFLQACDMVKFARYEPQTAEIERAFNLARGFVTETAESFVGAPETVGAAA